MSLKRAALAAVVLESLILSAFAFIPDSRPSPKKVTMLSLAALPEPEKVPPKLPSHEPPKVVHKAVRKAVSKPEAIKEPAPEPAQSALEPMPEKKMAAAAIQAKAAPVPEKQPPANMTPGFRDEVRAAVQAAVIYPMAARMAHVTGRAQVEFDYLDGVPSDARITVSSGNDLLDRAALAAVRMASYPRPAQEFAGKKLNFVVWVRFHGIEGTE